MGCVHVLILLHDNCGCPGVATIDMGFRLCVLLHDNGGLRGWPPLSCSTPAAQTRIFYRVEIPARDRRSFRINFPSVEVDRCFDGEFLQAGDKIMGKKRKAGGKAVSVASPAQRQRSWLSRQGNSTVRGSFRPCTLYRQTTKRCLSNVDCHVRYSINRKGLKMLQFNDKEPKWKNWRDRPFAIFS